MRAGKSLPTFRFQPVIFFLTAFILLASVTALATRAPRGVSQSACPSQADCDHLKAISDMATAEAAAAKAAADQAEADRAKDLADADRRESQASHPDPELFPKASDRVGYGQSMRAQAQGLRDKLANAKANAAARAKTAADAAKAYQDCLDRMKACAPKETTPQPAPVVLPQIGARTARAGQPVACTDGTTTTTVVPQPSVTDVLKYTFKIDIRWRFRPEDFVPPAKNPAFEDKPRPVQDLGNGWVMDWNSWSIRRKDPPTIAVPPIYIPPPCFINGDGKVTIGAAPGWYGASVTPPNSGYFSLPPNFLQPLNLNPSGSGTPVTPDPQTFDRLRRISVFQPPQQFIRPQNYYDDLSQYFWFFDLFGIPYYCSFDFPDTLRSFPEIRHALAVEEATRRRHGGVLTPDRANASLQLASFHGTSPFSASALNFAPAPQNGASSGQTANPSFTYSIVSNGKSTGEAFQLQLLDSTGKVKSVSMRPGTVLEAIAPGAAHSVAATAAGSKVVTQPMSGFCLEFRKHPPAEGTLYRIAGDAAQQKFRPMRFVSRAGQQMEQKKVFHPDSDPKAYSEAILQYALWSKLEGWSQEQFTQHFVERTKENADALHVKWTKEMENALRAAAPGRWKDISEMLQEAQDLQKNSEQRRGGRRGGGRGGSRGAGRSAQ
jgi:hypothetical protein